MNEKADDKADEYVAVARIGDIPDGQGRTYKVGDRLIAVFLHQGDYYAIDDLCPHMGASLGAGEVDERGAVTCPWHAWRFSVADGTWCDNPRLKIAAYGVRLVGDEIQVSVPAADEKPGADAGASD